jgi:hypothetical protein
MVSPAVNGINMKSWKEKNKLSEQVDRRIHQALRALPQLAPPPELTVRLRVAASRVRLESGFGAGRFRRWRDRLQLTLSNLMRPVALPAVGGFCSAVFLFSALIPAFVPALAMSRVPAPGDVPTMLTTEPMVKYISPIAFEQDDAVVDLTIDDQGKLVSYVIISAPGQSSDQLRRSIENRLLFTEFWPATAVGKPIAGTIRISFRSSQIEQVRG